MICPIYVMKLSLACEVDNNLLTFCFFIGHWYSLLSKVPFYAKFSWYRFFAQDVLMNWLDFTLCSFFSNCFLSVSWVVVVLHLIMAVVSSYKLHFHLIIVITLLMNWILLVKYCVLSNVITRKETKLGPLIPN